MKDISKYAKVDPAFFTDGLFVPKANKLKAIYIERQWDDGIIRFRGVQLGVAHQSVLLALCARVGRNGELVVKGSKDDLHAIRGDSLKCFDAARDAPLAIVEATAYSLLIDAGMNDSGTSYERLLQYLNDLQTLVVYRRTMSINQGGSSNLLKYSHKDDQFEVTLNWRLANAILGNSNYVQVSLFERNSLCDPVSKILHAWLSSNIRLGGTLGNDNLVYLDTLMSHVWGDGKASDDAIRQRRVRLKNALKEIDGVNGWICDHQGRKWRIVRPKDLGNDAIASPGEMKEAERLFLVR